MLSRRDALGTLGSALGAAALLRSDRAFAQNVSPSELAVPGPLGDVWQGSESAKVTIIGRGHSGTRAISHTLYASGVFMGANLNRSGDLVPPQDTESRVGA